MELMQIVSIMAVISTISGVPTRLKTPFWHMPCGQLDSNSVQDLESISTYEEDVKISLENVKLQHQLTLTDYLNRDYEFLYERVRIGVHQHQYIPNWIPGKKEAHSMRKLSGKSPQIIANHLPKFHTDLQKFAVAIEELHNDEPSSKIQTALFATQSYLQMMLCELESNIAALPDISIPPRIPRSIMTESERHPVDETRRLVRDWGVLLKYKDYLHAWRYVFNY